MTINSKILKDSLNNKIKAILFDLDGTLLNMNLDRFIDEFFALFTNYFKRYYDHDDLEENLRQINKNLLSNNGGNSNYAVIKQDLLNLLQLDGNNLDFMLSEFFDFHFSKLKPFISKKVGANYTVQSAFNCGYDVVIATNPVFPTMAAKHRLNWVGLGDYPYKFITGSENSSAIKPNLTYFEEIFNKLDRKPHECLMVGDMNMDMVAARLGCPTFFMSDSPEILNPSTPKPTYEGTLEELGVLIRNTIFDY